MANYCRAVTKSLRGTKGLCHQMNIFWRLILLNQYFLYDSRFLYYFWGHFNCYEKYFLSFCLLLCKRLQILEILLKAEAEFIFRCCGIQEAACDSVSRQWCWKIQQLFNRVTVLLFRISGGFLNATKTILKWVSIRSLEISKCFQRSKPKI